MSKKIVKKPIRKVIRKTAAKPAIKPAVRPAAKPASRPAAASRSVAGIMSQSAERVADIIVDDGKRLKGGKTQKITDETITMFKDVTRQLGEDIKHVKAREVVGVAAYSVGRASSFVAKTFKSLLE